MPDYLRQMTYAASYIAGSAIVVIAAYRVLSFLASRYDRDENALMDDLIRAIRFPAGLAVFIGGVYLALVQVSALRRHIRAADEWFTALITLAVFIALSRIVAIAITWYGRRSAEEGAVPGQFGLLRKIAIIAVWTLAVVQIMTVLGKPIGTLLASVGLVSLAVGLALQDTIANIFAGFYIVADRSLRAGDYVNIDGGPEGFVESVGWRNTKVRLWANNIVLVPNSKLVQSIITNMTLPEPALSVYTNCGVAYDSNLDEVERISIEVASRIIREFPGGDTSFEPVVRFKEFGDSNINCVVVFRAVEVSAQYRLQHEFIKALHSRFRDENIEISFPVRKLVWEQPSPVPQSAPPPA